MKGYHLTAQTGVDGLEVFEAAGPEPRRGEIAVRVRAVSLNYRDLMVADGRYGKAHLPLIPLSDGAGEVAAVGEGVTRWKPGDRVAGTFFQGWNSGPFRRDALALGGALDGMFAERVLLPEDGAVAIPPHLSWEEAATLPCAAVTAWHALVTHGNIAADETVLLLGTGGVSLFALQFAKMHGARVIITSSSDEKLARARALGADEGVNYRENPDWEKEVFRLTAKAGVDHVVEVVGGDAFTRSLRTLAPGGTVSLVGGVRSFTADVPLLQIIAKSAVVRGIYVGSREMFEAMNRAVALHAMRPVVDRVFPFAEAAAAYRYLESGAHFGKVTISFGDR